MIALNVGDDGKRWMAFKFVDGHVVYKRCFNFSTGCVEVAYERMQNDPDVACTHKTLTVEQGWQPTDNELKANGAV